MSKDTAAIAEMKATFEARKASLQAAQKALRLSPGGNQYIVQVDSVPVTFSIEDGKAVNAQPASPEDALRFGPDVAKRIAATVTNGAGVKGRAVLVKNAIANDLKTVNSVLAQIMMIEAGE